MLDIMRIIWLKTLLSGLCSTAWLCPWHLSTTVPVHLQGWKDNVKDNVEMLILFLFPGRMEGDFLLFACLCGRLPSKPGHVQRPWWVPVQVNISKIQYFQTKKTNCQILGRDGLDQNASSASRGRDASMAPALRWAKVNFSFTGCTNFYFYFNCINFPAWWVYLRWGLGR